MVAQALKSVDWGDETEYLPAMPTLLAMPSIFRVPTGIGLGFLTDAGIGTLAGSASELRDPVRVLPAHGALLWAVSR